MWAAHADWILDFGILSPRPKEPVTSVTYRRNRFEQVSWVCQTCICIWIYFANLFKTWIGLVFLDLNLDLLTVQLLRTVFWT